MIQNDHELAVTRERVAKLERLLERLRKTARPEEWPALCLEFRLSPGDRAHARRDPRLPRGGRATASDGDEGLIQGRTMDRHVNAIAGRLSLRPPQRESLEILHRVTKQVPPRKGVELPMALEAIRSEYPTVAEFEREFPSLCFALATGVGKTRLMGAFISYLRLAHGINNFFVLAPNLTIYNKLITDFTPIHRNTCSRASQSLP